MAAPRSFKLKDAIILCLFLLGISYASFFVLWLLNIHSEIIYDAATVVTVVVIIRKMGRTTVTKILTYRPVTVYVFFSLFVMFMGLEIISRELINLLAYILPVPDGFFGSAMPDNILLTVISSAIVPAFTEELFFRGVLLIRLRTAYGEKKAILFSALLFGLMHINPWQALNAFVGGLFYAWIYLRFKNIWLSMFMHMYFNILAFYMPFPGIIITSKNSYTTLIIHPPWFDALGLILFLAGLFITVQLTRPTLKPAPPPE